MESRSLILSNVDFYEQAISNSLIRSFFFSSPGFPLPPILPVYNYSSFFREVTPPSFHSQEVDQQYQFLKISTAYEKYPAEEKERWIAIQNFIENAYRALASTEGIAEYTQELNALEDYNLRALTELKKSCKLTFHINEEEVAIIYDSFKFLDIDPASLPPHSNLSMPQQFFQEINTAVSNLHGYDPYLKRDQNKLYFPTKWEEMHKFIEDAGQKLLANPFWHAHELAFFSAPITIEELEEKIQSCLVGKSPDEWGYDYEKLFSLIGPTLLPFSHINIQSKCEYVFNICLLNQQYLRKPADQRQDRIQQIFLEGSRILNNSLLKNNHQNKIRWLQQRFQPSTQNMPYENLFTCQQVSLHQKEEIIIKQAKRLCQQAATITEQGERLRQQAETIAELRERIAKLEQAIPGVEKITQTLIENTFCQQAATITEQGKRLCQQSETILKLKRRIVQLEQTIPELEKITQKLIEDTKTTLLKSYEFEKRKRISVVQLGVEETLQIENILPAQESQPSPSREEGVASPTLLQRRGSQPYLGIFYAGNPTDKASVEEKSPISSPTTQRLE